MGKSKFYVVWKGRQTGIFSSWEACSAQVSGYPGAEYKSFESLAAAESALRGRYEAFRGKPAAATQAWLFAPVKPLLPSICVDAACSGSPGPVEYRGVETASGREIFRQGPYVEGTNNIGEFLALVHALAWMRDQPSPLPVYSDSENALAWVKAGVCRTSLERTPRNAELFGLIDRAERFLREAPQALGAARLLKWDTSAWGENPADFGRK
jgi:ribonuclease HI